MPVELRMIDDRVVAAKTRPTTDDGREALTGELALLRSLSIDGVVRPAAEELTGEPALLLEPAGTATLATTSPQPDQVLALGRQLLDVVTSLHDAGITHGAIEPAHVLWTPGQDPVLCGFGAARRGGDPAADIEDLAGLLAELVPDDHPRRAEFDRVDGDPARLAAALAEPVMAPRGPRLPGPGRPPPDTQRRPRLLLGIGAAVAAVAVGAIAIVARPVAGGDGATSASSPATLPETTSTAPAPTAPAPDTTARSDSRVWPEPATTDAAATCVATTGELGAADVDGDGCPEAVDRRDDIVTAGAQRWQLGEVGDHVVLGDWWCTGTPTLALVTARAGDVHAFADWPTDEPATVTATTSVGPTTGVRVAAADGCDVLVIELADGTIQEVTP